MLSSERFRAFHKNLSIQTIYHLWYETKVASFTKELKLNFLLFGQANFMIFACIDILGFHKYFVIHISSSLRSAQKVKCSGVFLFSQQSILQLFYLSSTSQPKKIYIPFFLSAIFVVSVSVTNCIEFCILCSSFEHHLNKLTILIFWFCQFRSLCWEAFPSLSLRI